MGYSIAWLAVQGKPLESLLAELHLRPTGRAGLYPDDPVVGAALEAGWHLLVANGCDHRMIDHRTLKVVSRGCRVIACSIEEHVSFSAAFRWEDGQRIWAIWHQGDEKADDLHAEGVLPDFFAAVRDELLARRETEDGNDADIDYAFGIPLEVARRITGFEHCSNENVKNDHFEVLETLNSLPAKP